MKSRREEFRRMLGVRDDECMALATGNLTEVKGYQYLIAAVADLVNKGVAVKCFIAGQGELKDSLDRQIEEMRLEDSVKLLGYRDDVPALLGAADIFCMPSLSEALPYSLLEALAAGVPVVASRVGGIPEVITHGKEGFLVPAKNVSELCMAIQQLVSNPELRKKMSSQALATVSGRFSVGKMLSESGDLFFNELQHSR
jgi:glycosyltransferase involved in cell wall biosynthesis